MWKKCNINDNYIVSDDGFVKSIKTNKILKQKLDKDNYEGITKEGKKIYICSKCNKCIER